MSDSQLQTIGRAEYINFPELELSAVPARIDTGAKTSAIWATNIEEREGVLHCTLFGESSDHHTGTPVIFSSYGQRVVASSIGEPENRYLVKLLVEIGGRKIRASFTLANRERQVYPVLVGRNVLRGKFIVDVQRGSALIDQERERTAELHAQFNEES